jgi:hypothetical protein
MVGLMGFPARGFRPSQCYDASHSSDSDTFGRETRDQRRILAEFQRQAYMYRSHNQQLSSEGMGGLYSPFSNCGRPSPMMGGHPQFGIYSPPSMNMGGGSSGGMGFGMGMGMGSGIRVGMGLGVGVGMETGRGRGIGPPSQPPLLGGSRMGYGQSSPFGLGHSHQSRPVFTNRHRQNGQPSPPKARRTLFSTSLFDDDGDHESDYDTSTTYDYPGRRRGGFRQLGRSPYGARHRPSWTHNYNDRHEEYDDESDFEEYYPMRRRRPRY